MPPGRARLATKPAPTGSVTPANTIGKVRLTCCNAATLRVPLAKMMSGASATNSVADLRSRSASSSPQRVSIRTLRPTLQPNSCRPWWNAAIRSWPSGLSAARFMSKPMRRMRSACCARAANDHAAILLNESMNSRRWIWIAMRPSRRGHATEGTISHLDVLRCGISIRPMTVLGHSRHSFHPGPPHCAVRGSGEPI